ncbi:unnamed protein product [Leptidea sinapis]|uniref:Peptidase M1 leukotriene A4 hydrolase/aminopeptidase C-terminal domain-containing protein n=1 Tax=Leptidea sinapis TaxID=189913 RepID=A0A5E4QJ24_9NEOP|nr:unnamed protein product [Leptidea sinapis]
MAVIGKLFSRDNFRLSAVKHNIVKYSNTGIISIVNKRNGDNNYIKEIRAKNNWQSFTKRKLYTYNRNIEAMALSPLDPSSYSRPELAVVKHVELSLDVDFENKQLSGLALLTVNAIEDINEVKLRIKYKTSPSATALQWLEPKQTSGKKYPYMFSQCQPIHARSIMPCQDSPAVKFTYTAEVSAPENFSVLMSAIRDGSNNTKTTFRQPVPIPSYLLAIAVGVLESRELGPRSHVWAEKEEIERSAWEFADTEKYLQAAEALCGPYQWTQYDLLVLPPSFPYGGMENPCLTFAGDRSQADVIVHEIMHSWTGNLVTNRNFEHFWLNEGFTVFLERKVGASLISDKDEARKSRDFNSLLGLQELTETIKDDLGVENPLTQLVVNLSNVHPDDAFSTVPYEKGSLFLRVLEDSLGGPDTDQFKSFLFEYFKDSADQTKALNDVDWATWLHKPGMPPVIPENGEIEATALSPLDPSSFSRPEQAIIEHVDLILHVDFEQKQLNGDVMLTVSTLMNINELILDTSNLTIEMIELEDGSELKYKVDEHLTYYGSKLTIIFNKTIISGQKIKIRIKYKTSPSATALQWLEPKQTSGQTYPFLFSKCVAIHARSIMPCQDSPAVKFTYTAEVSAPENFSVLMSAIRDGRNNTNTTFRQPVPIPSYLLAIAVGVLESRELGPRSHVWAEKEEIERSAWEFADTEKYLQAAEAQCGPYQWTQYNLLVLPPSFPYGGMENPCLTFVTPTLLAGDRSQANVIVHEIVHSWTGNLVTNRNFEHFWLKEGFTVFLERKVGASLISDKDEARKSRDFNSLLGLQQLTETINDLGADNPLTQLVLNLSSVNPDDAFSTVPYEKGSLFLRVLEDLLGGPDIFDKFVRSYLNKYQRQSIDTEQFKSYLFQYFNDSSDQIRVLNDVEWETWLHKPGMPPVIPKYDTSMTKAVKNVLLKINLNDTASLDYNDVISFSPHQMINLLQHLVDQDALPLDKLRTLGEAYRVSTSKNTEIAYRWLRICIRSRDENKLNDSFAFVNQQGRMKYVRPIYRDLYAWEDVRERTIENFLRNEPYMMHVSAYTIRKDLHIDV